MLKRIYDICFALLFGVLTLPVLAFAYIGIKIASPGPAIYRAERIGKDGRPFTLYKFRSMVVNSGPIRTTTLADDDRVFGFGRLLRRSKIDELPQLFNVLKGEMSVVGPRPEDAANAQKIYAGRYLDLLRLKPGLTSPASLFDYTHGEHYASQQQYEAEFLPIKLEMELYYAQHASFAYDLALTLRTAGIILCVLFGKQQFPFPVEYGAVIAKIKGRGEEADYELEPTR